MTRLVLFGPEIIQILIHRGLLLHQRRPRLNRSRRLLLLLEDLGLHFGLDRFDTRHLRFVVFAFLIVSKQALDRAGFQLVQSRQRLVRQRRTLLQCLQRLSRHFALMLQLIDLGRNPSLRLLVGSNQLGATFSVTRALLPV